MRTKLQIISKIYSAQKSTSKHRGHAEPKYTLDELTNYCMNNIEFHTIYDLWTENNQQDKYMIPSIDRLDNNEGYSFENIQIVTFEQNCINAWMDTRSKKLYNPTLLNGGHKEIIQIDLDLNIVNEYISLAEACRQNIDFIHQGISDCLNNKRTLYKGFFWIDKNDKDIFIGSITTKQLNHIKKRYKAGFKAEYQIHIDNKVHFCSGYKEACNLLKISYPTFKKWINNEYASRKPKPKNIRIQEINESHRRTKRYNESYTTR